MIPSPPAAEGATQVLRKGDEAAMPDDSALFDKGLPIRRAVLGGEYVDRSLAAADGFTMALQRVATAWGWGWG